MFNAGSGMGNSPCRWQLIHLHKGHPFHVTDDGEA
jgi:hypothetical protein